MRFRATPDEDPAGGAKLRLLSSEALTELHVATLEVLERTGVWVEDDVALDIFADGGLTVERDSRVVRMDPSVVEDAIRSAPRRVTMCGRETAHDVTLGEGTVTFSPGAVGVAVNDVNTGLHRPATKKDVGDIARLIDAAAEIDLNCVVVAAQDVPPATQMVHGFAATIANTMKGVTACPDSRFAMERIVEIAMLVAGGEAELRERPLLDANVGLVSPLRLSREATDVLELAARNGIPSDPCSMAMAGGTAPVTIAGTLVVQNAELLAALVFTQLVERGVGFIYSTAGGHLDLRHATSTFGSPESALVAAGMTSLAEHYALPVFTNGLFGDAKLSDAQLGHEKTLCALSAALLGSHEIGGAGMVDLGMTFDFGQLLIDNEIAGMIRRFAAGIPVSDETLMIDEIHAAARSGDFLSRESTLRRTRDGSAPRLFERRVRDAWLADGGRELQERAIDEARLLLEEHVVAPLDTEVREEIERILTRADDGTGL